MPVGEEFQPEAAIVNYFASGTNSTQVMLLLFLIIKAAIDLYREMMEVVISMILYFLKHIRNI